MRDIKKQEEKFLPVFELVLSVKTLKKVEIVLDFWINHLEMEHISLPMGDIKKLQETLKVNRAWALNKSMRMINEPESTGELTDRAVKILDAIYEKAHFPSIVESNCKHLNLHQSTGLLN